MAHEIEQHDNMFSVKLRPWHGLGTVLEDYPTIPEAKEKSGTLWTASIKPSFFESAPGVFTREIGENAVVRDDLGIAIGHVGAKYEIYQNDQMWDFIEAFQMQSGCKLETAGTLRNGSTVWVLAKNGSIESIKGDPIQEFFLFRNSFNGMSNIAVMFTNIRVVCNNTLTAAISGAGNIFKVRHTSNATQQLNDVNKALGIRTKYQSEFSEIMAHLASFKMTSDAGMDFIENVIFPMPAKKVLNERGEMEATQLALTARANKIAKVSELLETGAGTAIDGVKGTGYGMWQALTEWVDHEKSLKITKGRDRREVAFENAFWGTGSTFKETCLNQLLAIAA